MAALVLLGAFAMGGLVIVYYIMASVRKIKESRKREYLYGLPRKTERGIITFGVPTYKRQSVDSYTVDNRGNMYTHIGGGGSYSILESYTLYFSPDGRGEVLTLHSIPGKGCKLPAVQFGDALVTYVTDAIEHKSYVIDTMPVVKL